MLGFAATSQEHVDQISRYTPRSESKIPLLGDIPLVGRVFRNETLNGSRNELIISVTPHIVSPGETTVYPGPPLPSIPTPAPLPTLPPGTTLPGKAIAGLVTPAPIMASPPPRATSLIMPSPPATTPSPTAAAPNPGATRENSDQFVFGSPPPTNVAGPGDPPKIFYAAVSPSHVTYGTAMQINTTTTTNVAQVSINYNGVSTSIPQVGAGSFAARFPFPFGGGAGSAAPIQLTLVATKSDGTSTSILISLILAVPTQSAAGH